VKEIRESGAAGKAAPDIASLIRATTTLDVGFAAGGNDITARLMGQCLDGAVFR